MLNFKISKADKYAIISFDLSEAMTPGQLKTISPPDMIGENFAHKGVILSGRGPVWLYCYLSHFYHPTAYVATYDPRLQGAVVVQSHTSEYKPGDIIPLLQNQ